MTMVRQTFTNQLPEDVVIWVEMDCWCWVLSPGEKLTVEFDAIAYSPDWEPLPIDLSFDGEGQNRRLMLVIWQQAKSEGKFFINGELLAAGGDLTAFGRSRSAGG